MPNELLRACGAPCVAAFLKENLVRQNAEGNDDVLVQHFTCRSGLSPPEGPGDAPGVGHRPLPTITIIVLLILREHSHGFELQCHARGAGYAFFGVFMVILGIPKRNTQP